MRDHCPLPLVALRGDETCPRCGRPAREHRGHPTYQEKTMTEPTEPTRERIEDRIAQLEWLLRGPEPAVGWETDLAVYRMALRTLDAEAKLAAMTERAESYKTMALSIARRVRDIHTIVCGEDDSLNPKEQHEAIVDVLRGHHALGPWTASEADLAHRIASDPCVVSKRWPGGSVEYARVVGEEAERAERSHRTLCGDSAQFLLRKAIPWIAAMTERAEKAERELADVSAECATLRTDHVRIRSQLVAAEKAREEAERECAEAWDVQGMAVARAEKAEASDAESRPGGA